MEKLILENRVISLPSSKQFRSWDAADEYLLKQENLGENILVIGDNYGALTCGLEGNVTSLVLSEVSRLSIVETLELNKLKREIITDIKSIPKNIDSVIVKLPKFIDLLEYYLQLIGRELPGVKVILGGMVKYMPISMVRLTEEYFTDVTTSLAVKKSRLIYGTAALNKDNYKEYPITYKMDNGLDVISYPGVFSYDHLDLGTRLLLEHLPTEQSGVILDLGCASGVLGLSAKKLNPEATVVLTDEAYLGVESARESFKANGLEGEFHVMNILDGYPDDSVDCILCNPPFHNSNRVLTDIAIDMFNQSKRVLKKGGVMYIVSNRHLGYHKKLREIFHSLRRIAENEKFNVFSVRKS